MKLEFLGTRGNIAVRTRRHERHSALLVSYKRRRILIDCGEDWRGRLFELAPHAIFITHAHPDHAYGLRDGAPCPVYATADTWDRLPDYPIAERRTAPPLQAVPVEGMTLTAVPVVHSLRAPAVGYRIEAGRVTVFYVPDVVDIQQRETALNDVRLYIGDGAALTRPIVRRTGGKRFGHTTIAKQLRWCAAEGVDRAIFTHCGSQIVKQDEEAAAAEVAAKGRDHGVEASLAHDGLSIVLR